MYICGHNETLYNKIKALLQAKEQAFFKVLYNIRSLIAPENKVFSFM